MPEDITVIHVEVRYFTPSLWVEMRVLQVPGAGSRSESENGVDAKAVLLWVLSDDRKQHHQHHGCGEHSNDTTSTSRYSCTATISPGNSNK